VSALGAVGIAPFRGRSAVDDVLVVVDLEDAAAGGGWKGVNTAYILHITGVP
jgi:hypothetical protein